MSGVKPNESTFLVDKSFSNCDINNVVRYCTQQLGGRLNEIVPISHGTISNKAISPL
jgi:hypothetical protein